MQANAQPRVVSSEFFRLTLPSGWKESKAGADRYVYRNDLEKRQLTVSALPIARPLDDASFRRILEHRIAAEKRELGATGQIDVGTVENNPPLRRVLFTVKEASPLFFATGALIATPERVVTLYLESAAGDYHAHQRVTKAIFDSSQAR